ncbi:MAG: hypothetical protein ACXVBB_16840, partial [Isosphaeraceae bacterium]
EQYTLNGTTWININSPLTAVSDGWLAPQTINFSGIAGASNDPNFGVRLVSVYDNSLSFPNYGSADGGQGGYYNQRPNTQLRIRAFCPGTFAFLAVFRVVDNKRPQTRCRRQRPLLL